MTDRVLDHDHLRSLSDSGQWQKIIDDTENLNEQDQVEPGYLFFRALALVEVGRSAEAIPVVQSGLSLDPASRWGNRVMFDAYRSSERFDEAFSTYAKFIRSAGDHEAEKNWYVQWASEYGFLNLAAEINETRAVIADVPPIPKFALAVQCFCKADTLKQVFQSLLKLDNAQKFSLVILQDSEVGSTNSARYAAGVLDVRALILEMYPQLVDKFYGVELLQNPQNLGTAASCRRLLDYVAARYKGFLFIEDDCIMAPTALDWAAYHLESTISKASQHWFVTCESAYFDKADGDLPDDLKGRLKAIANAAAVKDAYVLQDFVNSTCFGTTVDIWKGCAVPRSMTRGPESLNRHIAALKKMTIAPMVPRATDIGMFHELGFSVANVGADNVRENKGTYLLASGGFSPKACVPYTGNRDLFYTATSSLDEAAIEQVEEFLSGNG